MRDQLSKKVLLEYMKNYKLTVNQLQLILDMFGQKGEKLSHKKIVISILQPINPGLTKEDFIKILEENIYKELDLIG